MNESSVSSAVTEDLFAGKEKELVHLLMEMQMKAATAESLTGGMVSARITGVPGASGVFECGICSYSNRIKEEILGVSPQTLEVYTEYSAACAKEMAQGVRELSGADLGIATTGIAGPGGGTEEKPVGTVYVGISTKNDTKAYELHLGEDNSRERNRELSASFAIIYALAELQAIKAS